MPEEMRVSSAPARGWASDERNRSAVGDSRVDHALVVGSDRLVGFLARFDVLLCLHTWHSVRAGVTESTCGEEQERGRTPKNARSVQAAPAKCRGCRVPRSGRGTALATRTTARSRQRPAERGGGGSVEAVSAPAALCDPGPSYPTTLIIALPPQARSYQSVNSTEWD